MEYTKKRLQEAGAYIQPFQKTGSCLEPLYVENKEGMPGLVPSLLLNLFFPGISQLFLQQFIKGLLYLAVYYFLILFTGARWLAMLAELVILLETGFTCLRIKKGMAVRRLGFFC